MNRRQFLRASLAAAGGVVMLGRRNWAGEGKDAKQARWAFVSDTHVPADPENNYRGFYPYRNLQKVVTQIAADLPRGAIITGDLARLEGLPGDYANAAKLLAPLTNERPVCVALGNHDHRANFLGAFKKPDGVRQSVRGKHVIITEAGPVRLIVLDSLMFTNKVPGLLGQAQRNWLRSYLSTSDDKPILLFFHHTLGEGDGDLLDAPRLFDIVRPASNVKALVFGHSHAYSYAELEGIHLINLPATGYNFNDAQPVGWVEAQLTADGAAFELHAVGGNTAIDGQTKTLQWRS
ncbi:MAG: metallophosphoesterase [Sedimentisphaerales bacterium]|nr:metallophosphoesterase [Sedimentisphaerales bacterium]